jgi:hypothetical protein
MTGSEHPLATCQMTEERRQHAAENAKNAAGKVSRLPSCGNKLGIEIDIRGSMHDSVCESDERDKTAADVEDGMRRGMKDAGTRWATANDHRMGKTVINGMRWV